MSAFERALSDLRRWLMNDMVDDEKAQVAGYHPNALRRLRRSVEEEGCAPLRRLSLERLEHLAASVGVPLVERSATDHPLPLKWQRVDWTSTDIVMHLPHLYKEAKTVLAYSQRLDAWMMPVEMYSHWLLRRIAELDLDPKQQSDMDAFCKRYHRESVTAREHAGNRSRVIVPGHMLEQAASWSKAGPLWIKEVRDTARKWSDYVRLAIAPEDRWQHVQRTLARRVGAVVSRWSPSTTISLHTG